MGGKTMKLDKDALELARARNCMTMKALATAAKVSTATICSKKDIEVFPATAGRIAKALNVDVTEIIIKE